MGTKTNLALDALLGGVASYADVDPARNKRSVGLFLKHVAAAGALSKLQRDQEARQLAAQKELIGERATAQAAVRGVGRKPADQESTYERESGKLLSQLQEPSIMAGEQFPQETFSKPMATVTQAPGMARVHSPERQISDLAAIENPAQKFARRLAAQQAMTRMGDQLGLDTARYKSQAAAQDVLPPDVLASKQAGIAGTGRTQAGEYVGARGEGERRATEALIGQRGRSNTDGAGSGRIPQADEAGFVNEMIFRGYIVPDETDWIPKLDYDGNVIGKTLNIDKLKTEIADDPRGAALWDEFRRTGTISIKGPETQPSSYPWER
jgi:hypothetical protein